MTGTKILGEPVVYPVYKSNKTIREQYLYDTEHEVYVTDSLICCYLTVEDNSTDRELYLSFYYRPPLSNTKSLFEEAGETWKAPSSFTPMVFNVLNGEIIKHLDTGVTAVTVNSLNNNGETIGCHEGWITCRVQLTRILQKGETIAVGIFADGMLVNGKHADDHLCNIFYSSDFSDNTVVKTHVPLNMKASIYISYSYDTGINTQLKQGCDRTGNSLMESIVHYNDPNNDDASRNSLMYNGCFGIVTRIEQNMQTNKMFLHVMSPIPPACFTNEFNSALFQRNLCLVVFKLDEDLKIVEILKGYDGDYYNLAVRENDNFYAPSITLTRGLKKGELCFVGFMGQNGNTNGKTSTIPTPYKIGRFPAYSNYSFAQLEPILEENDFADELVFEECPYNLSMYISYAPGSKSFAVDEHLCPGAGYSLVKAITQLIEDILSPLDAINRLFNLIRNIETPLAVTAENVRKSICYSRTVGSLLNFWDYLFGKIRIRNKEIVLFTPITTELELETRI